jgi:hypothetical protein
MTGQTLQRLLAVLALLFTSQLIHSQNKPPTVTLSVSSTNAILQAGSYVGFTAHAADEDGQVQKVELYRNSSLLQEIPNNSIEWAVVLPGINRFYALAYDNLSAQSYSEIITITGNPPPTVTLTEPSAPLIHYSTNEIVVVRGTASDSGGSILEVRLLENGKAIAADLQAPYEFLYKPTNFGSFSLQLEAVDNHGATQTSQSRTVQYVRVNDNLELTIPINTGAKQILLGSNTGATHQKGEPQHAAVPGGKSIWWAWRAGSSGTVTIETLGSDFDTVLAVYTNRALQGLTVTNLVEVASNDDDSAIQPLSRVKFHARTGVIYYIAVDGRDGVAGNIQVVITLPKIPSLTPPPHDFIAQAVRLTSGHQSHNRGATTEPDEPEHGPNSGGASIWYRIDAGTSTPTQFRITTEGSGFDTVLAVYTNAVSGIRSDAPPFMENLRLVAFNDDGPGTNRTSALTITAPFLSGPYWIAVDGYNGAQGNVLITMTSLANSPAPTNDFFSRPTTLVGSSALTSVNTLRATSEGGEPSPLIDNSPSKSVWYRWVAPANGPVYMTTRWSDFDSVLAVYTGTNINRLQLVAANDDDPSGLRTSALVLNAIAGTEYRIGISGYRGAAGNLIFALNQNAFYLPRLITQFQQGQISLSVADISAPVVLESSSDLITWNQVRTLSSNEPLNLPVSTEIDREFYRVRTLE